LTSPDAAIPLLSRARQQAVFLFIPLVVLLFFVVNRAAYQGYFMDDDLDNIGWNHASRPTSYLTGYLSPLYYPQHFRPVGHFAYYVMSHLAGLNYRWYVALIHSLHFANALLLWWLLKRLALPPPAAAAGAFFFLFQMALFDVFWKPMYQFDSWCALFSLLSLHCWMSRRWLLSFFFFWTAYKAKEHAVMLPAAFLLYEWWLGEKRWKPLIPFFLTSLSFGLQGLFRNEQAPGNDYVLRFSGLALARTFVYYMTRMIVPPLAGFLLLLLPRRFPDKRLWFGLAFCGLLLLPNLALSSKLSPAYLYVSMIGVALALAVVASRIHWAVTAVFFLIWLPVNYNSMRQQRRAALTYAHENRAYISSLSPLPTKYPAVRRFVFDGWPQGLRWWGIRGALHYLYGTQDIELIPVEEKNLAEIFSAGPAALLNWDAARRTLEVVGRSPNEREASYLRMERPMPLWQLEEGWYQLEGKYRWTKPVATARLHRPANARHFDVQVLVGPQYIEAVRTSHLEVLLDGRRIGSFEFTTHGWRTVRLDLDPAPAASTVRVEFRASPPFQPAPTDRVLGIALVGFGFAALNEPMKETR
jgi:hypothetical protein